ncbi:sigma factor G inhibitor Gin [Clostridium sp. YB-6]|uniref:Sigma factor G inhibitor Gin n=2 Tax=Clostridium weizhouense TaxID=2859781 RepID=A0ABS7AQJ1_9CLOT|nr:sigma factor G inhibitor Gin [Clostridium weizhouense]
MMNKKCFVCSKFDDNGIILNGKKICNRCENEIINLSIINPEYNYYKNKIKAILFKKDL